MGNQRIKCDDDGSLCRGEVKFNYGGAETKAITRTMPKMAAAVAAMLIYQPREVCNEKGSE